MDDVTGDGQILRQRLFSGPAEDDVIHAVDGVGSGGSLIGGGIGYHITAGHQIDLAAGEQIYHPLQIGGIGNVHRNIVGEEMDVEVTGYRQIDDLAADQMRLGLLGPGELIHGQIDIKAHIPDGMDNTLVRQGKGIKRAGI